MLELFQTFALPVLAIMIVSYLLGSISFSIIFTKMFSKEDIRTMGSGNAGTTNVLRSVGKRAAILTFVFDILKCVISVLLAKYILEYICAASNAPFYIVNYGIYLAGFCCSIGHMYPIFFKFKGGKGVVTVATMAALADYANHGVFPEENVLGQKFVVSAVMYTDTRRAGLTDELGESRWRG